MSDGNATGKLAAATEKIKTMENKPFFRLFKPYLDFLDSGKIFSVCYVVMAVVSLLLPIAAIFAAVKIHVFDMGGRVVVGFIFIWLFVILASWIGFQLWWDRKSKVTMVTGSEFVATPIFSQMLQTLGEWLGTFFAVVGVGMGIVALIVLGDYAEMLPGGGIPLILVGPVAGFFTVIFFRFLAEQVRIFVALANNTGAIARNIKKD
ncbi:MAG: hypothetical protein LBQ57_07775 [Spirochaetales bacterium]|jgi:hypothetical protein|nr:hypothetical protein [Spirochaetales bacterium]